MKSSKQREKTQFFLPFSQKKFGIYHFKWVEKKFSIFIGNSGSIIESLERGLEVIQVCDDYLLDVYSSKIWPSIKTTKIDEYIYTYKLKKKGNLIKLGTKKNNLKKIFLRT